MLLLSVELKMHTSRSHVMVQASSSTPCMLGWNYYIPEMMTFWNSSWNIAGTQYLFIKPGRVKPTDGNSVENRKG